MLDAVILSRAKVFLGNPSSTSESLASALGMDWKVRGPTGTDETVSILPYRRVVDWNQGLARYIAHDHKVPDDWEWHLDWSHA